MIPWRCAYSSPAQAWMPISTAVSGPSAPPSLEQLGARAALDVLHDDVVAVVVDARCRRPGRCSGGSASRPRAPRGESGRRTCRRRRGARRGSSPRRCARARGRSPCRRSTSRRSRVGRRARSGRRSASRSSPSPPVPPVPPPVPPVEPPPGLPPPGPPAPVLPFPGRSPPLPPWLPLPGGCGLGRRGGGCRRGRRSVDVVGAVGGRRLVDRARRRLGSLGPVAPGRR